MNSRRSVLVRSLTAWFVGALLLMSVPVPANAVPQAARDKAAQEAEVKRRAEAERQRQQEERAATQQRAARAAAERTAQAEAQRRAAQEEARRPLAPEMVTIAAGCFQMGSTFHVSESPVHQVCIPRSFGMGKHEVTFDEYDRFVAATRVLRPWDQGWGRGTRPVINVSWEDANRYAQWLSAQTGMRYRLPTEAEWEYATRAGSSSEYWWGDAVGSNRANCTGCGGAFDNQGTAPAGTFPANPWGLFDVHGNVYEWVQDCTESTYAGAPTDGSARDVSGCSYRGLRGGAFSHDPVSLRSASRNSTAPFNLNNNIGFRLAQDI